MPVSSVDAMRPPSPPPAGTMDDLDYEEEAASAFEERFTGAEHCDQRSASTLKIFCLPPFTPGTAALFSAFWGNHLIAVCGVSLFVQVWTREFGGRFISIGKES
eukprot:444838-Rhodomonas_salina.1